MARSARQLARQASRKRAIARQASKEKTAEHKAANLLISRWRRFCEARQALRNSEDTRLGNDFRNYGWTEPSPEVAQQAFEEATFQKGKADIWAFETDSFDELGLGALLYFRLLKSLVLMFGLMSVVALPALVVTYSGTRLLDKGMTSNFLTTSTLGNIVVTKCNPAGNLTAGTRTCGQEVCIKRPANLDTLDGNGPAILGAIVGAVAAFAIGSVFGEDAMPCKTKAPRTIGALGFGTLFALLAVPLGGFFGCISSSNCVTSVICFPATRVFYVVAASDWANVIIFLAFTLYFLDSITKMRTLVDHTHITADDYTVQVMGLPARASKEEIRAHFSSLYQLSAPPWNANVLEKKLVCVCIRACDSGRREEWTDVAKDDVSGDIEEGGGAAEAEGGDDDDDDEDMEIPKPVVDMTHINKYTRIDEPHDGGLQCDYLVEHGEKPPNWVAEVAIVHPNSTQVRLFLKSKKNLLAMRRTRALIQRLSPGEKEFAAAEGKIETAQHAGNDDEAVNAQEEVDAIMGLSGLVAKLTCKRKTLDKVRAREAKEKMHAAARRKARCKLCLRGCFACTCKIDPIELDAMTHKHDLPPEGRPYPPRTPLLKAKTIGCCKHKLSTAFDTFEVEKAFETLEHLEENTRNNQKSHDVLHELEPTCCNKKAVGERARMRADAVVLRAFVTFNNKESYIRALADHHGANYPCYNFLGFGCCVPERLRFRMHGEDDDSKGHALKVHPAKAAGGILWENLDTPTWQVNVRKTFASMFAIGLLAVSTVAIAVAKAQGSGGAIPDFAKCAPGGIDTAYYGYLPPDQKLPPSKEGELRRNREQLCPSVVDGDWSAVDGQKSRAGNTQYYISYPDAELTEQRKNFICQNTSNCLDSCYSPQLLEHCWDPCVDPLDQTACPTQACIEASNNTGAVNYMKCGNFVADRQACMYSRGTIAACYCVQEITKLAAKGLPTMSELTALHDREKDLCGSMFASIIQSQAISTGTVVFIAVLNIVLKNVMTSLSLFERQHNISAQSQSLSFKAFLALFVNTALIMLIINWKFPTITAAQDEVTKGEIDRFPVEWYPLVGAAVLANMLINLVTPHIPILLLGPKRLISFGMNWTKTTIQYDMNELAKGPPWAPQTRYPFVMNTVFVTMLYSGGMPLLYPLAMLYFIANYWVDKGSMLRVYRVDGLDGLDGSLAKQAMELFPWAVVLHCAITVLMYSDPRVAYDSSLGDGTIFKFMSYLGGAQEDAMKLYDFVDGVDPIDIVAMVTRTNCVPHTVLGVVVFVLTLFRAPLKTFAAVALGIARVVLRALCPVCADCADKLAEGNELDAPIYTGPYELPMDKRHSAYFMKEFMRVHRKEEVLSHVVDGTPWVINIKKRDGPVMEGTKPELTKRSRNAVMTTFASVFELHNANLGLPNESEPSKEAVSFADNVVADIAMLSIYGLALADLRCFLIAMRDEEDLSAQECAAKGFLQDWNDTLSVCGQVGETKKRKHLIGREYVWKTWAGLSLLSNELFMDCHPSAELLDNDAVLYSNYPETEMAREGKAEIHALEKNGKTAMFVRWDKDCVVDGVKHKKNERMRTWEKIRMDGVHSYNIHNNPRYQDAMRWAADEIMGHAAGFKGLADITKMKASQNDKVANVKRRRGKRAASVAGNKEIAETLRNSSSWKSRTVNPMRRRGSSRNPLKDKDLPQLPAALLEELEQAFIACDSKGRTSKEEIHLPACDVATLMAAFDAPVHDHELDTLMRTVDTDGNGTVEFDELVMFMRIQRGAKRT